MYGRNEKTIYSIKQAITLFLKQNPKTEMISIHFIDHKPDSAEKITKAKEILSQLVFTPHSLHCIPSRCTCYLKHINELRELLK